MPQGSRENYEKYVKAFLFSFETSKRIIRAKIDGAKHLELAKENQFMAPIPLISF